MTETKEISFKDLIPIEEVKGEINLFMFNSKHFSTDDMKINNKLMEAIGNVKIQIAANN